MHAFLHRSKWRALILLVGLSIACAARADVIGTVDVLRIGGCGGLVPAARALRHEPQLDRAAQAWADGTRLARD